MYLLNISDAPSQTFDCQLNGQYTNINIYQKSTGLYCDVYVNDALVIGGVICENLNKIVRNSYLGFSGDLFFLDTEGDDDPQYPGLGSRFLLYYILPGE